MFTNIILEIIMFNDNVNAKSNVFFANGHLRTVANLYPNGLYMAYEF